MRLFKVLLLWIITVPIYGQGTYLTLNDGARIFVDEVGEGQTLLFIPGWTMTHKFFEHQKSHYAANYHVLLYDPRGQGRSDKTTFKNTYKDHADDLQQILQQRDLSNVVLIGWSSGCLTVYEYLRTYGFDSVDKVVLIDEPPKWIGDTENEWVYGSFGDYRSSLKGLISGPSEPDGIIDWMLNEPYDRLTLDWMSEEILMTPPHVGLSLYIDGLVSDYQLDLIRSSQKVPTLAMIRWNWFDEAKSWLDIYAPGIKLNRISSHAMFWERPEVFNEMLTTFLERPHEIKSGPVIPQQGEMLIPRYGPTAVTDGESIYVYGGAPNGGRNGEDFMHHGLTASMERIDPLTLKSEYFGSGLYRRANHASVFRDQQIISCGGRSQIGLSRPRMNSCEYLELSTGLHKAMPSLPEALRTLGMAEVNGDLYVFGGLTNGSDYSDRAYRLKVDAQAWEQLPEIPDGYTGQAITVGDKIYLIGGYNGKAMRSVMIFDTQTAKWRMAPELPYPLSAYSAVVKDQSIFIFGDYQQQDVVHRYDIKEGKLYRLQEKITPRRHTAAVLIDGKAIIIGGNQTSAGKALTAIESFDLERMSQGTLVSDKGK